MQPNPVDTTNILLVQLTMITLYGPSAALPLMLSSSTDYSSKFWTLALAYASLAFSLLAAFGAVLGKQWLGYYKTNRYDRGSLADRCKQRHRKFQKLQKWKFENVLQSFTVLIQLSLFLFGISLGVAMWTKQRAISILIISTTAFGALSLAVFILLSLISPDSPFHTPLSLAIQAGIRLVRGSAGSQHHDAESTESAMWWILDTSTNPDVLTNAFELMSTLVSKQQKDFSPSRLCEKVLDMLKECFGVTTLESNARVYGKALIHLYLEYPNAREILQKGAKNWSEWTTWREMYLPQALEHCHNSHRTMLDTDNAALLQRHQAETRTALRMIVATGINGFTDPDDESSVWDLQCPLKFESLGVDWLMKCIEHFCNVKDFAAARYALLLLSGFPKELLLPLQKRFASLLHESRPDNLRVIALRIACSALNYKDNTPCHESFTQAFLTAVCPHTTIQHKYDFANVMNLLELTEWPQDSILASCELQDIQVLALFVLPAPKVDEPEWYTRYCQVLTHCMGPEQPDGIHHTALRKVTDARQYLPVSLHSEFSQRLLTIVRSVDKQSSAPDQYFYYYTRLIFALVKRSDWGPHLDDDGHIRMCIEIVQKVIPGSSLDKSPCLFYLTGIFLQRSYHFGTISTKQWWHLMKMAWCVASDSYDQSHCCYVSDVLDDDVEILKALAAGTQQHMPPDVSKDDLKLLREWLGKTAEKLDLRKLESRQRSVVTAVKDLRNVVRHRLGSLETT